MVELDTVWAGIESNTGERFVQILGGEFTYEVASGFIVPDRTNRRLPKPHFEKAFRRVPLDKPSSVQHLQGPSYLFAILMDERIRRKDW
jgi:hypothetical protein